MRLHQYNKQQQGTTFVGARGGAGGWGGGDVRVRFRRVFWLFVFVSVGQHAISDQPAKGAAVVVCGVRCVSFVICHLQF